MAYTQVQTLVDTPTRHVTKRINSGNTETSALFVNAASLNFALATLTLKVNSTSYLPFSNGEVVNAAAGGAATVQYVINASTVVLHTPTGTFTTAQNVVGFTSNVTREQLGALVPASYRLSVTRILYNIFGGVGADGVSKVQLEWEGDGAANNRVIAVLSGAGTFELDTSAVRANNNAVNPTGNILLTTLGWNANSHYSLIVDLSKNAGYNPSYMG